MALHSLRLRRTLTTLSSLHRFYSVSPATTPNPVNSIPLPMSSVLKFPTVNRQAPISIAQSTSFRWNQASLYSSRQYKLYKEGDEITPDTILFEGCDYNHWLITMDFPKDPAPSREEMIATYEQTCAKGLNISLEEAKKRIYACSTTTYQGFQAIMTEEESEKFRDIPGVVFILPDSYIDPVNKEYGGDKYENGVITPRPPPVQYGRNRVRDRIEAYTSLLSFGLSTDGLSTLEKLYGKTLTVADREMVEEKADNILTEALQSDVAFLVVGDPFGATTHSDLVVRAKTLGVDIKVVHNASVMNAIGICGLQLYHYGETISIPFFTETWRPDSFYEKIQGNRSLGLHTLCLLDIRVKEPSLESLCRGKKKYEPPRYMTINTAIEQLLEVEQTRGGSVYNEETECVGFARLGCEDQMIVAGTMKQLLMVDFGAPLHCLVIVGKTHPVEEEMLNFYKLKSEK